MTNEKVKPVPPGLLTVVDLYWLLFVCVCLCVCAATPNASSWKLDRSGHITCRTGDQENGGQAQSDCVCLHWWKRRDRTYSCRSRLAGKLMSPVSVVLLSPYALYAGQLCGQPSVSIVLAAVNQNQRVAPSQHFSAQIKAISTRALEKLKVAVKFSFIWGTHLLS